MKDKTLIYQNDLAMTKSLMKQKMGDKSLPQRALKSELDTKEHVQQSDTGLRLQPKYPHGG